MSDRRTNDGERSKVEPSTGEASGGRDLDSPLAKAAQSFGFFAVMFVMQPESWPVFLSFARSEGLTPAFTWEKAMELVDWHAENMDWMGKAEGNGVISAH